MRRAQLFLLLGGLFAPDATTQLTWRGSAPLERSDHAMVYDESRRRLVVFGGLRGSTRLDDTWEWDGSAWHEHKPAARPSPRNGHKLAYDHSRRRVVLFGGRDATGQRDDTWQWDGTNWVELRPVTRPSARELHALAWDGGTGRVLLHGGTAGRTVFDDTWTWDGNNWRKLSPPQATAPLFAHSMVYDPVRRELVMCHALFSSFGTWAWNGTTWRRVTPRTDPALRTAAIAFDEIGERVVMFGATRNGAIETWAWNGLDWARVSGARPWYSPAKFAVGWDGVRRRVVVFGGRLSTRFYDQMWELDGSNWSDITPPNRLWRAAVAHDAKRDRIVLFGGIPFGAPIGVWNGNTWEYDGSVWRLVSTSGPPARNNAALAYDADRERTVLFGGERFRGQVSNDTWEWNGTTWSQRAPGASPPARKGHGMTYDSTRKRVVLFGGAVLASFRNDTWEWDGQTWSEAKPPTVPRPRESHGLVFDELLQRVLLFGGGQLSRKYADTWTWDGADWRQLTPATSPPARSDLAMAYDSGRGRAIVFGGVDRQNRSDTTTWEWTGSTWLARSITPNPGRRTVNRMAYHAGSRRTVLVGLGSPSSGTWTYGASVDNAVSIVGAGCRGSRGVPAIAAVGRPILGNSDFALRVSNARPSAPVFAILAAAAGRIALPGGCTLYQLPPSVVLRGNTSAVGVASFRLPVTGDPVLRGARLPTQALVLDPNGAFAGLAFTAGLRCRIGD